MKNKILILVNHEVVIYNFRKELVYKLLKQGYEVYISCPEGEKTKLLQEMGAVILPIKIDRHSKSPFKDIKLLMQYFFLIKKIQPDVILTYTIKPNIYGSIACTILNKPYLVNITGLGSALEEKSILQIITVLLYKIAMRKANKIYVQNSENLKFFIAKNLNIRKLKLLPGSGVNLEEFHPLKFPQGESIHFLFIARVMKEKGIDQFLEAARYIKSHYINIYFHVLGFCEGNYEAILKKAVSDGIIEYHGNCDNLINYHKFSSCTILPSYYPEGISNVLLESAACARPIITTDRAGCRETVDDEITGYLVKMKDTNDLIDKIEKFIKLSVNDRETMGIKGRVKIEKEYNREIIVNEYYAEIKNIIGGKNEL